MTDKIYTIVIRVNKKDSSFVYFTLESNEGLCFYSTLKHEKESPYREIEINLTKSLLNEFLTVFHFLTGSIDIEILKDTENITGR